MITLLIFGVLALPLFLYCRNQLDDGMPVMTDEEWKEYHTNMMCCTSPKEARAYERQYKKMLLDKRRREPNTNTDGSN